jgi:xylan 1,4-beta-xylosidase
MLGIYEKRQFSDGEKVWLGRYKNLVNVLHWHFEAEIIRIVKGSAKIKIGNSVFEAKKGDCFFCTGEELHYIIGKKDSEIDIAIFDEKLCPETIGNLSLFSPKLPSCIPVKDYFSSIKKELTEKGPFYREAVNNKMENLIIDIFRKCNFEKSERKTSFQKSLITKINNEYSFITFEDAVGYSGYSASHFSKMFKAFTGMTFSEYLNVIKIENAIILLRENLTMTSISQKCGFSTIRNFNRVFKKITGYPPLSLPSDFTIDTGLRISDAEFFDPTDEDSILM